MRAESLHKNAATFTTRPAVHSVSYRQNDYIQSFSKTAHLSFSDHAYDMQIMCQIAKQCAIDRAGM